MAKAQVYVDTVNLMAYDYYEPSSDPLTGHHAPLFTNPADPRHVSADASIQAFERAGVPAAKILLGVPFYGHMWDRWQDIIMAISAGQAGCRKGTRPIMWLQMRRRVPDIRGIGTLLPRFLPLQRR